jgi:hypothetical protein
MSRSTPNLVVVLAVKIGDLLLGVVQASLVKVVVTNNGTLLGRKDDTEAASKG